MDLVRAGPDQVIPDHHTLPFGVFSKRPDGDRRVGVRVDDTVLDLCRLDLPHAADFGTPSLNAFLARGRAHWDDVRTRLQALLSAGTEHLLPAADLTLHLPFEVADYVDFYSSRAHAENVGAIFRPDSPALPAAWEHLPIGYHGRAGTVAVSGTPVHRPAGLRLVDGAPEFGPSRRLDIEAEVGVVVGTPAAAPVPVGAFADHVFGICLVDDWSARDIQAFEYVPLGPFLGKSFLTSISPWVVPLAALEHARVPAPPRDQPPAAYLDDADHPWGLDLQLEVRLNGAVVSRPPFATMHWTAAQQLAHLTVNGAALRTGDLLASGTVSGPRPDQVGSLLELTGGAGPFLADGDVVTISATAPGPDGTRLDLGEVTGTVLPAR